MRQCENIFVFIDLTKSIGSDLGPPPKLRLCLRGKSEDANNHRLTFKLQDKRIRQIQISLRNKCNGKNVKTGFGYCA